MKSKCFFSSRTTSARSRDVMVMASIDGVWMAGYCSCWILATAAAAVASVVSHFEETEERRRAR